MRAVLRAIGQGFGLVGLLLAVGALWLFWAVFVAPEERERREMQYRLDD